MASPGWLGSCNWNKLSTWFAAALLPFGTDMLQTGKFCDVPYKFNMLFVVTSNMIIKVPWTIWCTASHLFISMLGTVVKSMLRCPRLASVSTIIAVMQDVNSKVVKTTFAGTCWMIAGGRWRDCGKRMAKDSLCRTMCSRSLSAGRGFQVLSCMGVASEEEALAMADQV